MVARGWVSLVGGRVGGERGGWLLALGTEGVTGWGFRGFAWVGGGLAGWEGGDCEVVLFVLVVVVGVVVLLDVTFYSRLLWADIGMW